MDLVEVVPGLHLLRFTNTNTHLLNAYLWCDDDGVTVIDTERRGAALSCAPRSSSSGVHRRTSPRSS